MTTDARRRAEEIRKRHEAFVAQYSPGPDWEPCNQMSKDRGWLLDQLDAVAQAVKERDDALIEGKALLDQAAHALYQKFQEWEARCHAAEERERQQAGEIARLTKALQIFDPGMNSVDRGR